MARQLTDFRLATKDEISTALRPPAGLRAYSTGGGIFVGSPGGVHRTVVFKVMHETFGDPNSHPGEKSTWEWVIYSQAGLLSVYDYKGAWSVGYCGINVKVTPALKAEAEALRDAILTAAVKVYVSKQELRDKKIGGAILNPYAVYSMPASDLMNEARRVANEVKEIKKRGDFTAFADSFNRSRVVGSLYRATFTAVYQSLEGFINLLYVLFLRDRYRQ